ncbi:MAG: cytochrome C oxidase subunit I [Gammaproteobacteria bacterium]|nr:MAG: cytochrome C oxidase subunit I [Gammaproteobacteria bacterium]
MMEQSLSQPLRNRTVGWIWLGVYSLLAAGLLSLCLALARTPGVQDLFPGTDFFHVALVVHVDLSVLVWFMACAGMVWTLFGRSRQSLMGTLAFGLAVLGAVMISIAPFIGADRPLMNNYVPVLQHPWFFAGLAMLAVGVVLQAVDYLRGLSISFSQPDFTDMVRLALALAAVSTLIAVAAVAWTFFDLPLTVQGERYFEVLFWGGGHILQFTNSVLVLVAWFLLGRASGSHAWLSPGIGMALFALVVLPLIAVPWIYRQPVEADAAITEFTTLMRWGGLATLPLGLAIGVGFIYRHNVPSHLQPLRAALLCSLTLFAAGGFLGFLIRGSNTMIPAHYHGSIVGVTLAFMGVVYYLLPKLGFTIKQRRLLYLQPYLFAGGQLMHITGLAMSGGYGVQRKVAGADQMLSGFHETLGMGMMGMGGLLAAVGGLCFLIIAISALRGERILGQLPVLADHPLTTQATRSSS